MLEQLAASPTIRPSELARAIGVAPSQAHSLLRRPEEEGAIKRTKARWTVKRGARQNA